MTRHFLSSYKKFLSYPWAVLFVIAVMCLSAMHYTSYFTYDASADTLVAENDPELAYYRKVSKNFGGDEFLFLTYQPKDAPLLSVQTLQRIDALQGRLEDIKGVKAVTSILDAPLLQSPPIELGKMAEEYKTLRSPDVDLPLAMVELTTSPFFKELLISADGDATALRIDLAMDEEFNSLWEERKRLKSLEVLTDEEHRELSVTLDKYDQARREYIEDQERLMVDIREIRDSIGDEATAYLGGVPMVASDMISYVKSDIIVFGSTSLLLIMASLFAFFRRLRWVLLPVLTAGIAILITMGILGFIRQPATVVSSNFVALLLIFSISFTVHLMVKYRELVRDGVKGSHRELVAITMTDKFAPCIYTALTTMAAFASLMTSDIIPVTDFGWIMCVGMAAAFTANYTFFPAVLTLLPEGRHSHTVEKQPFLTSIMCSLSVKSYGKVLLSALVLMVVAWVGMSRLSVDSRFIDYFKEGTEIREGLTFIDTHMGGTIPMDIIINFPPYKSTVIDEDDDFFTEEEDEYPERYWFTPDKIEMLHKVHNYLETKEEIGKVISLATLEEIARGFNDGKPLGSVELAAVLGAVPSSVRNDFINPYSTPSEGMLRISTRVHETAPPYSRSEMIDEIKHFVVSELGISPNDVRVTGMNVLFNDMLASLFDSQVSTIGFVVGATFLMFLILLRSPMLALVGVLPNLLSATMVLAFMGFVGMPLDMMTITIAAIIIGIGVDDAIHYLHRFQQELLKGESVKEAIETSHSNIGIALYFTSITVIIGFSVLGMSNFVPTIYFGLLTALAMILALLANLTILPSLLMRFYR